jgi:hypothetical protein
MTFLEAAELMALLLFVLLIGSLLVVLVRKAK